MFTAKIKRKRGAWTARLATTAKIRKVNAWALDVRGIIWIPDVKEMEDPECEPRSSSKGGLKASHCDRVKQTHRYGIEEHHSNT
jgi:hypothetical protein